MNAWYVIRTVSLIYSSQQNGFIQDKNSFWKKCLRQNDKMFFFQCISTHKGREIPCSLLVQCQSCIKQQINVNNTHTVQSINLRQKVSLLPFAKTRRLHRYRQVQGLQSASRNTESQFWTPSWHFFIRNQTLLDNNLS